MILLATLKASSPYKRRRSACRGLMSVGDGMSKVMAVLKGRIPRCGLWDSSRWSLSLCERLATAHGHLIGSWSTGLSVYLQVGTSEFGGHGDARFSGATRI